MAAAEVRAEPAAPHPWEKQEGRRQKLNDDMFELCMELPGDRDLMGVDTITDLHTHWKITDCDTDTMVVPSSHSHGDLTSGGQCRTELEEEVAR